MNSERILVVDDDTNIASYLGELLDMEGFAVAISTSSLDALGRITGHVDEYDVLITDNYMPGLTGGQLVQKVRAAGFRGKIVMYSGDILPEEEERLKAWGVDAVLHKPLGMTRLIPTIQQLCAA